MSLSPRFLWHSASRLRDELLLMAGANLIWLLLTLPLLGLLLFVALFAFEAHLSSGLPSLLPLLAAAFLALALPTPAAVGLYCLALPLSRGESSTFAAYWSGLARHWRDGLAMFVLGLGGLVLATANAAFYFSRGGWWQSLSVVWLNLALLWLLLQPYLLPLLLAFPTDRLWRRYRRAGALMVAHPGVSLALLLCPALLAVASLVVPPLYALLAMAFLALAGTRALADLQRQHGPAGGVLSA